MKCPNDKTEMEKGYLSEPGDQNVDWYTSEKRTLGIFDKSKKLTAYRCPKCGKVELTTEIK